MTHRDHRIVLALDRGSVRSYSVEGFLQVSLTPISKANVCGYLGSEIPDYEALGLEADREYQLLRDPDELARGGPTSNGKQLMATHIETSADDPQKEFIAGAVGTDARFIAPYLMNSLTVWDQDAIDLIENEKVKELSCGYRYVPDMTPGTYEGAAYDGVMRDIVFNHVALVPKGRAGSDVVVGDALKETLMSKGKLSHTAAMVKGALAVYLGSKLANDQSIDLGPFVAGVTKANWGAKKAAVLASVTGAVKGKLAKDADIGDMVKLMDAMKGDDMPPDDPEAADVDPAAPATAQDPKMPPEPKGTDGEGDVKEVLGAIMAMCKKLLGTEGADEPEQTPGAATAKPGDDPASPIPGTRATDKEEKDMVQKSTMDAALATERARADKAIKEAETRTIVRMNAIADAREEVKPYVGQLALACDSVAGVYRAALEVRKIDTKGMHEDAYRHVLLAQPRLDAKQPTSLRLVNDAALSGDLSDIFPDMGRLVS